MKSIEKVKSVSLFAVYGTIRWIMYLTTTGKYSKDFWDDTVILNTAQTRTDFEGLITEVGNGWHMRCSTIIDCMGNLLGWLFVCRWGTRYITSTD